MKLQVYSEIKKLKTVLLHRPSFELENLTPNFLSRLLFDDIPAMQKAQKEHDAFADVFRRNGAEVLYLEDLVADVLVDPAIRESFTNDFLNEAQLESESLRETLKEYFAGFQGKELVLKMMAGVRKSELPKAKATSLYSMASNEYPLAIDPMPNLYFTRDPFSISGSGVAMNRMHTITRCRETLFGDYVFQHHPLFRNEHIPYWYDRTLPSSIEGGDILTLTDKVLAIGISQRTEADAIEAFARRMFASNEPFERILAFDIPKIRAYMHLDTVFTMIDENVFTVHPGILAPLSVFALERTSSDGGFQVVKEEGNLESVLKKHLGLSEVELIQCAGGDFIDSEREQWNDGSNTLAIAPGEVVVYERNYVTNKILRERGIKLHEIEDSELSRGRGGPRCMSMPLVRER